jgi:hypothetical protein
MDFGRYKNATPGVSGRNASSKTAFFERHVGDMPTEHITGPGLGSETGFCRFFGEPFF